MQAPSFPEVAFLTSRFTFVGVAYLLVALLLWNLPMWMAHKLIPKTNHDNHLELPVVEATRVGCCLIGLWVFIQSAQGFVWTVITAFLDHNGASQFSRMTLDAKAGFLVDMLMISLSVGMMFKSNVFARWILRFNETKQ